MAGVAPPGSAARASRMPDVAELFTGRKDEAAAFKASLLEFARYLERDNQGAGHRLNLVTFHGMSGIGKTALSQRLEKWVNHKLPPINGWGSIPSTKVAATGRIDLHDSAGQIDLMAALLALRAGVARVKPRWPLFDLAFAAYWSATRPGDPLPSYRGVDMASDVQETVHDALADLSSLADLAGGAFGGGLAVRGVRKLIDDLRYRKDLRLGINAFDGFEQFLVRCADEPSPTEAKPSLACEIAGTLAWELDQISPTPMVVLFVDATERLAADPRRSSEGYLNQLIYQIPNVFFVLTGRNELSWWDETRVELSHRGRWTWPGLAPEAATSARQHELRPLTPADTITVIKAGRDQLELPMSDEVIKELAKASSGIPHYLELARQVGINTKDAGHGRQVAIADVTGTLRSLVICLLDDVPPDEQRAIRSASLFRTFDAGLVAAAANVDHGCAERALTRSMIDRYEGEQFPYRMHDAVREALRAVDHKVDGGWSEQDWQQASTSAAAAARRLHDDAKIREDKRGVLDAIGIAIRLACEQPTKLEPSATSYEDWLTRAIVHSPSVQGLSSRVPGASQTDYGRRVLQFIEASTVDRPIAEHLLTLREVFHSHHPLRHTAGRHLGYALRGQCRWDEALAVFDELILLDPDPVHVNQRANTLSLARRFVDALAASAEQPSATAAAIRGVEYAHGNPDPYFDGIDDKLTQLRAQGRQREYVDDCGEFLVRRALFRSDVRDVEIHEFLRLWETSGHNEVSKLGLQATILAQKDSPAGRLSALQRLRLTDLGADGSGKIGFRFALAEFCDALLADDRGRLLRLSIEVEALEKRSRAWIPVEAFLQAIGLPVSPVPAQWMEPPDVVNNRWAAHLDRYLASHGRRRDTTNP